MLQLNRNNPVIKIYNQFSSQSSLIKSATLIAVIYSKLEIFSLIYRGMMLALTTRIFFTGAKGLDTVDQGPPVRARG